MSQKIPLRFADVFSEGVHFLVQILHAHEFNFNTLSDILATRSEKNVNRYRQCDNIFVNTCNYIVRHVFI